ncbi:Protein NETWORKED 4A, partial [Mucuna pruriens]
MTKRSLMSEMERNVRQMLKLIEEGGDSFAQKAEMYYQKRPELIALVEEFYRGYKSLVERFEHNACDLQSQASGVSDNGSETSLYVLSPRKVARRISTNRAAGFDVFLGSSVGNVNVFDACQKDGDGGSSTLTESDEEDDDASSNNSFSGFFANYQNRRVMEFDIELPEGKERVCNEEERVKNGEEFFRARVNAYEQELRNVNEKLRISEGEMGRLKVELDKYRSVDIGNFKGGVELCTIVEGISLGGEALELNKLGQELRMAKEKLESSEMQIVSLKFGATKTFETIQQLQEQLDLAHEDIASWKTKFNTQKRESSKLQERVAKLRSNVADRDREVRDLKASLFDVEQKIFFERAHMRSEMSKLLDGRTVLAEKIKEWECQCQCLEQKLRKIHSQNIETGERLKGEIELLKEDIQERKRSIEDVNVCLDALRLERDNLNAQVASLKEVIYSNHNEIEEAHKQEEELTSRAKKLEEEIERQRVEILQGAEEKREAIRQLCFSLEHYRSEYNLLRQAFMVHKRCHRVQLGPTLLEEETEKLYTYMHEITSTDNLLLGSRDVHREPNS